LGLDSRSGERRERERWYKNETTMPADLHLIDADQALIDRVMDDTFVIWSEGLDREAYRRWDVAQRSTPWGRANLSRVVLCDGDRVLASAKRYRFVARVAGEPVPVVGVGAVFTPTALRGHGHARELMDRLLADEEASGCGYALLFSEIGASYYLRLGFEALARTQQTIVVPAPDGAPAVLVRSGEATDLATIAEISALYAEDASFALERSADLIGYGIARRRLLAGLGLAGMRQAEFFVTEEGHRAVAYVFLTRGPNGTVLEECGDRDPTGARVGAILQVLAAREPAEPVMRMETWLPDAFRPPQLRVIAERDALSELMMVKPLGGRPPLSTLRGPIVYWRTDVF